MRRRFRRRSRSRRSVSWIPGLSGMEVTTPAQSRMVTFAAGLVANTRVAAIEMVDSNDLAQCGGEDCVLQRITYELAFYAARRTTDTAVSMAVRMMFVLKEIQNAGATDQFLAADYATSTGLGSDDILHTRDFVIGQQTGYADGSTGLLFDPMLSSNWIRGEVKARRKLSSHHRILIYWTSVVDGGFTPQDFRFIGHARTLIKHAP